MTSSSGHTESKRPTEGSGSNRPLGSSGENQNSDRKTPSSSSNESRLGSIARETRGLLTDIKDWIDLRVQLLQFEVEERIEAAAHKIISLVIVAIMGLFAVLFVLLAISEAVGAWLGHPAYGHLSVGLVLMILTWIVYVTRPRFSEKSTEEKLQLSEPSQIQGKLTVGTEQSPKTERLDKTI